jgi:tetratricopeptide (TPR) repeat protein
MFEWWRDWRERRDALRGLKALQSDEEEALMMRTLNPLNMATESLGRRNEAEAARQWERARVLMPNISLTSPDSLDILLALRRYDEAEELMRLRGRRYPREHVYLTGLARIAEARGDIEEALKRWTVVRHKGRNTVEGFVGCGRCLELLGRLDEAERQFGLALRRDPSDLRAMVGQASISDRRRDWPRSLERWKFMAEKHRYSVAFAFVAKALAELGRIEEAEEYLRQPSMLYPRELEIIFTYASLAHRRGDPGTAAGRWATVRSAVPDHQIGYDEGARCLAETGCHTEADAVLLMAIELFPDEPWPLVQFARLAHNRQDWRKAVPRWDAVRQRFPEDLDALALWAEASREAGQGFELQSPPRDA